MASHLPHLQETFTSLPPPPPHHVAATAGPLHPPPPPTTAPSAPTTTSGGGRGKRKAAAVSSGAVPPHSIDPSLSANTAESGRDQAGGATASPRPPKKSRTNTPWSPAEEQRLKAMRDAGSSWSDIAKTFPTRTEGSVKKHWYKDMHYAEFAEDESAALLAAIKEYEANKWKVIGQKVGKPAKACEQYAKEHFGGKS
ncbi:MAG: hypothetical protein M1816_008163 [Peltula sp. TS41687]|nr:MAG: hypothetical protein M1816_008163 [Peltula sp. TS41687]